MDQILTCWESENQKFMEKKHLKILRQNVKKNQKKNRIEVSFFQSNSEGEIIEKLQNSDNYDGIIINAGAFTHTSIAIHDALKVINIPKIEVHISNIYKREDFRKNSFISSVVDGIIAGFGTNVYLLAIKSLTNE